MDITRIPKNYWMENVMEEDMWEEHV